MLRVGTSVHAIVDAWKILDNERSLTQFSALTTAAILGDVEKTRQLLSAGADVKEPLQEDDESLCQRGLTPLHVVAGGHYSNSERIMDLLLNAQCRLGVTSYQGQHQNFRFHAAFH